MPIDDIHAGGSPVSSDVLELVVASEQIRTLLARYCRSFDDHDEAAFVELWAEGATLELAGRGAATGRSAIAELVRQVWSAVVVSRHHITNPIIEVDADRARAVADVLLYRESREGATAMVSGRYVLDLTRERGQWRFRRLEFTGADTRSPLFDSPAT